MRKIPGAIPSPNIIMSDIPVLDSKNPPPPPSSPRKRPLDPDLEEQLRDTIKRLQTENSQLKATNEELRANGGHRKNDRGKERRRGVNARRKHNRYRDKDR